MSELPFTGERYVPTESGRIAYEHYHRYAASLEAAKGKVVADIACGEGFGSALLSHFAERVIGIDIDPSVILHAKRKYQFHDNIAFIAADCRTLPLEDQSVDLIISFETIEHVAEHELMLLEFQRILRPSGAVIISTPDKNNYRQSRDEQNPFHVKELTHGEFSELVARHFHFVRNYGQRLAIASFLLSEDSGLGVSTKVLQSFVLRDGKVSADIAPLKNHSYSVLVCAKNENALVSLLPSVYINPSDDLFAEQERVMRWASGVHQEHQDRKSDLAKAIADRKADAINFENRLQEVRKSFEVALQDARDSVDTRLRQVLEIAHGG